MNDMQKLTPAENAEKRGQEMAEAEWHIANATVDVGAYIRQVEVGEVIADAAVFDIDGQEQRLASFWAGRPLLIVNGSLSCPPSRRLNSAVNEIAERYADGLQVIVLYVIDAHPDGDACPYTGTDWLSQTNKDEDVRIRQPRDQHERCQHAGDYRDRLGLKVQVLVDGMNNEVWEATGKSPNSAVLLNPEGECLLSQQWFAPDELVARLDQYFQR